MSRDAEALAGGLPAMGVWGILLIEFRGGSVEWLGPRDKEMNGSGVLMQGALQFVGFGF